MEMGNIMMVVLFLITCIGIIVLRGWENNSDYKKRNIVIKKFNNYGKLFLCIYDNVNHYLSIHKGKTAIRSSREDKFKRRTIDIKKNIEIGKDEKEIVAIIETEAGKYVAEYSKHYKDLTTSNSVDTLLNTRYNG